MNTIHAMGTKIFIETERLYLRKWQPGDEIGYSLMNSDKEVMEYFPATLTAEQSMEHISKMAGDIDSFGYGLFAVERKEDAAFIGFTGFSHPSFTADFTPCTEIGWRLGKQYWNQGYATEAAKACLVFGFEKLLLRDIYSWTSVHNARSEQVMKKIGMHKVGLFDHPKLAAGHWLREHILYKISTV